MTTVRAGMLMPSASVSVAKTARTSPASNSSSTTSLKVGSMPAWWAAMPRCRPVEPLAVAEHREVVDSGMSAVRRSAISVMARRLVRRGQPQARVQALPDRRVAARPG